MSENGSLVGASGEREKLDSGSLESLIETAAREWKLTVDAVDSGLVVVDEKLRIRRLNRAASRLAGRSFEQLVGQSFDILADAEPWIRGRSLLLEAFAQGCTGKASVTHHPEGRRWEIRVHLPQPTNEGEPLAGPPERAVLVLRDITRELDLQESLARSEWMSALGSLVAAVAHEVRNPLFGISSTLDAFEARFGDRSDQAHYLYVLRSQLARLNGLMQQLLDYGKPPKLDLVIEWLPGLVAEAAASRQALADRCGVTIEIHHTPDLPALAMDRQRLLQVLENLIENALHHAPRGSAVEVVLEREEAGPLSSPGGGVVCRVRDRGPGFGPQDLPGAFEPFFTRRSDGVGLGLSIVQRIVEQHGGSVAAGNRPEGGAELTVRLPLEPPPGSSEGR